MWSWSFRGEHRRRSADIKPRLLGYATAQGVSAGSRRIAPERSIVASISAVGDRVREADGLAVLDGDQGNGTGDEPRCVITAQVVGR
jgi:hypothetical protein